VAAVAGGGAWRIAGWAAECDRLQVAGKRTQDAAAVAVVVGDEPPSLPVRVKA